MVWISMMRDQKIACFQWWIRQFKFFQTIPLGHWLRSCMIALICLFDFPNTHTLTHTTQLIQWQWQSTPLETFWLCKSKLLVEHNGMVYWSNNVKHRIHFSFRRAPLHFSCCVKVINHKISWLIARFSLFREFHDSTSSC